MKNGNIWEKRLINAKEKKDPLSVAIICYQIVRESPRFLKCKKNNDEEKMKEVLYTSVISMFKILDKNGWTEEMINSFFQYFQEFVKEI